jgi:hypothetical protein
LLFEDVVLQLGKECFRLPPVANSKALVNGDSAIKVVVLNRRRGYFGYERSAAHPSRKVEKKTCRLCVEGLAFGAYQHRREFLLHPKARDLCIYHHVSEAHLHRYLDEFDFRYSNRSGFDIEDAARTEKALKGLEGKRLMYRQPDRAAHA